MAHGKNRQEMKQALTVRELRRQLEKYDGNWPVLCGSFWNDDGEEFAARSLTTGGAGVGVDRVLIMDIRAGDLP